MSSSILARVTREVVISWLKRISTSFIHNTSGKLTIIAAVILAAILATAATSRLSTDPVYNQPANIIEMALDRGLILEIVVRCQRNTDGQILVGIISYSKIERVYCSSKNSCYSDPKKAVAETCNW